MGRKRKTRWRRLSIGETSDPEEEGEEPVNGSTSASGTLLLTRSLSSSQNQSPVHSSAPSKLYSSYNQHYSLSYHQFPIASSRSSTSTNMTKGATATASSPTTNTKQEGALLPSGDANPHVTEDGLAEGGPPQDGSSPQPQSPGQNGPHVSNGYHGHGGGGYSYYPHSGNPNNGSHYNNGTNNGYPYESHYDRYHYYKENYRPPSYYNNHHYHNGGGERGEGSSAPSTRGRGGYYGKGEYNGHGYHGGYRNGYHRSQSAYHHNTSSSSAAGNGGASNPGPSSVGSNESHPGGGGDSSSYPNNNQSYSHHLPPRGGGYYGGRFRRSRSYPASNYYYSNTHNGSNNTDNTNKPSYNQDEYTKITTPRQDVLFKKGYLSQKKPQSSLDSTSTATTSTPSASTNGTPDTQSTNGINSDYSEGYDNGETDCVIPYDDSYYYGPPPEAVFTDPTTGQVYYGHCSNGGEYYDAYPMMVAGYPAVYYPVPYPVDWNGVPVPYPMVAMPQHPPPLPNSLENDQHQQAPGPDADATERNSFTASQQGDADPSSEVGGPEVKSDIPEGSTPSTPSPTSSSSSTCSSETELLATQDRNRSLSSDSTSKSISTKPTGVKSSTTNNSHPSSSSTEERKSPSSITQAKPLSEPNDTKESEGKEVEDKKSTSSNVDKNENNNLSKCAPTPPVKKSSPEPGQKLNNNQQQQHSKGGKDGSDRRSPASNNNNSVRSFGDHPPLPPQTLPFGYGPPTVASPSNALPGVPTHLQMGPHPPQSAIGVMVPIPGPPPPHHPHHHQHHHQPLPPHYNTGPRYQGGGGNVNASNGHVHAMGHPPPHHLPHSAQQVPGPSYHGGGGGGHQQQQHHMVPSHSPHYNPMYNPHHGPPPPMSQVQVPVPPTQGYIYGPPAVYNGVAPASSAATTSAETAPSSSSTSSSSPSNSRTATTIPPSHTSTPTAAASGVTKSSIIPGIDPSYISAARKKRKKRKRGGRNKVKVKSDSGAGDDQGECGDDDDDVGQLTDEASTSSSASLPPSTSTATKALKLPSSSSNPPISNSKRQNEVTHKETFEKKNIVSPPKEEARTPSSQSEKVMSTSTSSQEQSNKGHLTNQQTSFKREDAGKAAPRKEVEEEDSSNSADFIQVVSRKKRKSNNNNNNKPSPSHDKFNRTPRPASFAMEDAKGTDYYAHNNTKHTSPSLSTKLSPSSQNMDHFINDDDAASSTTLPSQRKEDATPVAQDNEMGGLSLDHRPDELCNISSQQKESSTIVSDDQTNVTSSKAAVLDTCTKDDPIVLEGYENNKSQSPVPSSNEMVAVSERTTDSITLATAEKSGDSIVEAEVSIEKLLASSESSTTPITIASSPLSTKEFEGWGRFILEDPLPPTASDNATSTKETEPVTQNSHVPAPVHCNKILSPCSRHVTSSIDMHNDALQEKESAKSNLKKLGSASTSSPKSEVAFKRNVNATDLGHLSTFAEIETKQLGFSLLPTTPRPSFVKVGESESESISCRKTEPLPKSITLAVSQWLKTQGEDALTVPTVLSSSLEDDYEDDDDDEEDESEGVAQIQNQKNVYCNPWAAPSSSESTSQKAPNAKTETTIMDGTPSSSRVATKTYESSTTSPDKSHIIIRNAKGGAVMQQRTESESQAHIENQKTKRPKPRQEKVGKEETYLKQKRNEIESVLTDLNVSVNARRNDNDDSGGAEAINQSQKHIIFLDSEEESTSRRIGERNRPDSCESSIANSKILSTLTIHGDSSNNSHHHLHDDSGYELSSPDEEIDGESEESKSNSPSKTPLIHLNPSPHPQSGVEDKERQRESSESSSFEYPHNHKNDDDDDGNKLGQPQTQLDPSLSLLTLTSSSLPSFPSPGSEDAVVSGCDPQKFSKYYQLAVVLSPDDPNCTTDDDYDDENEIDEPTVDLGLDADFDLEMENDEKSNNHEDFLQIMMKTNKTLDRKQRRGEDVHVKSESFETKSSNKEEKVTRLKGCYNLVEGEEEIGTFDPAVVAEVKSRRKCFPTTEQKPDPKDDDDDVVDTPTTSPTPGYSHIYLNPLSLDEELSLPSSSTVCEQPHPIIDDDYDEGEPALPMYVSPPPVSIPVYSHLTPEHRVIRSKLHAIGDPIPSAICCSIQ